jgi:hypothetical protein
MIMPFLTENYFLHGTEEGKYSLMSPILHEKGKRWFYPHFGFAYKAINAKVKVIFVSDIGGDNSQTILLDQSYNEHNTNWEYFFKNLSDVDFLNVAWSDDNEPESLWQIILLFEVSTGGFVSVDNIGKNLFYIMDESDKSSLFLF